MALSRHRTAWLIAAGLLGSLGSGASEVHAEWQPQWSTHWQYTTPHFGVGPLRVAVTNTGDTFAAVEVNHDQRQNIALMKFHATGNFAWLQENAGAALAGIVSNNDRVTIAGEWGTLATPIGVRQYDAQTGELTWERMAGGGRVFSKGVVGYTTQRLAVDAQGNVMILASDQGDYVVIRFDTNGNALPTWRRTVDPDNDTMTSDDDVSATDIVALPDGGAILTGRGRELGGGYVTVRLDAQGNEVFADIELGDIGNPLGLAHLALDTDGSVVVAATPESFDGVFLGQVWKLSPSGTRLWTRVVPHPGGSFPSSSICGLVLAPDGDAVIETTGGHEPFRLLRLDGLTGEVIWDVGVPIAGAPVTLALAPNGRVLVASLGSAQQSGHIAEMDAAGNPCRVANNPSMFSTIVANAGADGWSILGATQLVPGSSRDAFVSHFDGSGACTPTDYLFANGFD